MINQNPLEVDTAHVLNKDYLIGTIAYGLTGHSTPIFDRLASKVFARETHRPLFQD